MPTFRAQKQYDNRLDLGRALLISIAIHFLVFWPAVSAWRDAVPAVPLSATLRPSAAPVIPASEPAIERRPAGPSSAKPSATSTPPAPVALPGESRLSNESDILDSTTVAAQGSGGAPTNRATGTQPAAVSSLPPTAGVDAEGLRSFRIALSREARRYKKNYPAQAIEAGWAGTVELRVTIAAGNASVQLAKSSGHPVLDDAAVELISQALPATPLPASLRARDFSVELPVLFELPQ